MQRDIGDAKLTTMLVIESDAFKDGDDYIPNKVEYLIRGPFPSAYMLEPAVYSFRMIVKVRVSSSLIWRDLVWTRSMHVAQKQWKLFLTTLYKMASDQLVVLEKEFGLTHYIMFYKKIIRESVFPLRMPHAETMAQLLCIGLNAVSPIGWKLPHSPFISWASVLKKSRGLYPAWDQLPCAGPEVYDYYWGGGACIDTLFELENREKSLLLQAQQRLQCLTLDDELEGRVGEYFDYESDDYADHDGYDYDPDRNPESFYYSDDSSQDIQWERHRQERDERGDNYDDEEDDRGEYYREPYNDVN